MSGVKTGLAGAVQNTGVAGKPAANAGQNDQSIDEILASIRQIISEQNRQADYAAEKAALEVANKPVAVGNVESVIGTIAADHWSGNPALDTAGRSAELARPVSRAADQAVEAGMRATHPGELDELIQLIGSSPVAPRAPAATKWIDPQSRDAPKTPNSPAKGLGKQLPAAKRQIPAAVEQAPVATKAPAQKLAIDPSVVNPVTTCPAAEKPPVSLQETKPVLGLHPSVSPQTAIPQVIKKSIANPSSAAPPAALKPADPNKPIVSHKSALDRLIAKKESGATNIPAPNAAKASPQTLPAQSELKSVPAPVANAQAPTKAPIPQAIKSAVQSLKTPATPARRPAANSTAPAAISAKTVNEAVTKSIERLATAMFADRKDEIDGMMAGIVRPMLQDWLEDNLPSLVERIVREEIERVSRGTHR